MLKNLLKSTALVLALGMAGTSLANAEEGISVANGKVKFDALTQFWFVNDTSLDKVAGGIGGPAGVQHSDGAKLNMLVRRAEMNFSGALSDSTRWMITIDPAKAAYKFGGDANILDDVVISQTLVLPELSLDVGQMKLPTVAESMDADGQLMFPERSMVARTWGETRQLGAMVSYKANMWKLSGMLSNGTNTVGNNMANDGNNAYAADLTNTPTVGRTFAGVQNHPNNKDVTVRFDVKPMSMISGGAFVYMPNMSWGYGGAYGVNARLMPIEDLIVRGEYVRGRVNDDAGNRLARNGYVVDAGYQYGDFQPVVRYEIQQQGLNPATGTTQGVVTGSAITAGLNYYLVKHNSKIQFAYTFLGDNTMGSTGATPTTGAATFPSANGQYQPSGVTGKSGGGLATLAFQVAI